MCIKNSPQALHTKRCILFSAGQHISDKNYRKSSYSSLLRTLTDDGDNKKGKKKSKGSIESSLLSNIKYTFVRNHTIQNTYASRLLIVDEKSSSLTVAAVKKRDLLVLNAISKLLNRCKFLPRKLNRKKKLSNFIVIITIK